MDLAGKTVVFLGPLRRSTWNDAARSVAQAGGTVRRGLSRRADIAVVGHGAHVLLDDGRLTGRIAAAEAVHAEVLGEDDWLRRLGLLPALAPAERTLSLQQIAAQAGLGGDHVRMLALFGLLQPDAGGNCGFRDLVAAREVARLLAEGTGIGEVVAATLSLRPDELVPLPDRLARVRLARGADGAVVQRIGNATADLDGQLRLPLDHGGNAPLEDLFEQAFMAEEDGDLLAAESLYRRCLDADRNDPTAAYNLANVLRERGKPREARLCYERALSMDRGFVEARYNLAHILEGFGDIRAARRQLLLAVEADPAYPDALFNLAGVHYREGDLDSAIACWERYLKLDAAGEWAERARQSLALCRMERQAGA